MDFFAHQEQARKKSQILVVLYGAAVLAITVAIYALLMAVLNVAADDPHHESTITWWNAAAAFWTVLLVPCVILTGSCSKVMQLRKGGGASVARMLGGTPVRPDTTDPDERKLLNVVEEMAIAAGVPVPMVYVMTTEQGINAFAAGYTQRDAVIGVTRGCMKTLSRDELQGVIAHEFSHIVNGDMRLNIRLMGVLFGIVMITLIGRILLRTVYFSGGGRSRGGKKEGGNPLPLIGLALIIIGYIGVFFANLIKSAISRQREFLADAAAVQYTRNPNGIASALSRIAKLSFGSRVSNPHAEEAGHLFFGDCSKHFFALFATHPSLQERIRRIDANIDLTAPRSKSSMPTANPTPENLSEEQELAGAINLAAAQAIMQMTPPAVEEASHDIVKARATLYAMLWFENKTFQQRQRASLERLDPEALAHVPEMLPSIQNIEPALRLPLAERLIPALRLMPPAFYPHFSKALVELTEANEEINLFEFAIRIMILRQLGSEFGAIHKPTVRYRDADKVKPQIEILLAALARWGTSSADAAEPCFRAGMQTLQWQGDHPKEVSLDDVESALTELAHAAPYIKRRCMRACTSTILHDGNVAHNQYELLRAIADGLDVPMPPMQPDQQKTSA